MVRSFAIPAVTPEEATLLERVRMLRRIEEREKYVGKVQAATARGQEKRRGGAAAQRAPPSSLQPVSHPQVCARVRVCACVHVRACVCVCVCVCEPTAVPILA